jgi:hypothetical protein
MALYQRGNIWWMDVMVAGQRIRESTKQRDEEKARRVESLRIAQVELGEVSGLRKKSPLLREFLPQFLQYTKQRVNISANTKRYYSTGVKLLEASPLVSMRIDGIRPVHLDTVSFGGSPANENLGRRTLSKLIAYACHVGLCGKPLKVPLLEEQGRDTLITWNQEKAILDLGIQPLSDVLICILDGGWRPHEVVALHSDLIRWSSNHYQNPRGKTPRARRKVAISERMRELFERRATGGWLFPNPNTETGHERADSVSKQFRAVCDGLKFPKSLKLYSARHTWATDVGAEVGLAELQQAGGWADAKIAMRYQHPGGERVLQVVNARNAARLLN